MKLLLLLLVLPMIGFAQNVNIPNENDKKLEKPTEFDANKSDFKYQACSVRPLFLELREGTNN